MRASAASWILLGALLLEALLSRAITGSGLHETLLLAAAGLRLAFARLARRGTAAVDVALGLGVALGGWRLLGSSVAPVTLSDLPALFHLAMGIHFWAWCRWRAGAAGVPGNAGRIALVLGGAAVVWAVGAVEIYSISLFQARAMAMAVMVLSLLAAAGTRGGEAGAGTAVMAVKRRDESLPGASIPRDAAAGGVLLLLALAAAWSLALGDRAAQASYRWLGRMDGVTDLSAFGQNQPAPEARGGAGDGSLRELPRRADLRLDDSLRFHIQIEGAAAFAAAASRPLYLRTSALSMFTREGLLGPRRAGEWIYDADDGAADGLTLLANEDHGDAMPEIRYWTLIQRAEARGLPLMPGTWAVELPGLYAFADGWYQLALDDAQEQVRYRALAKPVRWRDLPASPAAETGEAPADYLRLPASPLGRRILGDVRAIAPASWPLDRRLAAIQDFLAARCAYSLRYENPDDLDPVENFLYGERLGHCELYAASTTLLLRAAGVPARVAFGYCGGEADPARGLIAFRQSDYHAWAEIYLRDRGWVVFDTTPSGEGAARPPRVNPRSPALAAVDPAAYEDLGGGAVAEAAASSRFIRALAWMIDGVARWFLLACGAGAAVAAAWWWRRAAQADTPGGSGGGGGEAGGRLGRDRLPGLWSDYLRACAALGLAKAPGQTLGEFLRVVRNAGLDPGGELGELTAYLCARRYASQPADPAREERFRAAIKKLAAARGEGAAR